MEEANPASWKPVGLDSKDEQCALGCRYLPDEPERVKVLHITLAFPESCYERHLSEFSLMKGNKIKINLELILFI